MSEKPSSGPENPAENSPAPIAKGIPAAAAVVNRKKVASLPAAKPKPAPVLNLPKKPDPQAGKVVIPKPSPIQTADERESIVDSALRVFGWN